MNVHRLGAGIASLALLFATAACGGSDSSTVAADCEPAAEVDTIAKGKLTALIVEYPPYIEVDGDTLRGPDGELITRVAEALCLEIDATASSTPATIEGLKAGRADISANAWYSNEERAGLFELSDPVYSDAIGLISKDGHSSIDDLEGLTVGTPAGVLWTKDLQAALGSKNVKVYPSESAIVDDLIAGRLDAGLTGQATAAERLKSVNSDLDIEVLEADDRIEASLTPALTVALVAKGNTGLRDVVNQVVADYRSSGDLAKALEEAGVSPDGANVG